MPEPRGHRIIHAERSMDRMALAMAMVLALLATIGSASQKVSVIGNQFFVDGTPRTLIGFTHVGRINPRPDACSKSRTSCCSSRTQAWNDWSSRELIAARDDYSANTVRMQISRSLLDPSLAEFDRDYLANIIDAVGLIRSQGLIAQLSMQWEDTNLYCSITQDRGLDSTVAAWRSLLETSTWISHDHGIIFELMNEPPIGGICGTSTEWERWRAYHQTIVDAIRGIGATNVLIAGSMDQSHLIDGSSFGGSSLGSYLLNDSNIAYSIHAYPNVRGEGSRCLIGEFRVQDWNRWIGDLARQLTVPIIITEWATGGSGGRNVNGQNNHYCWDSTSRLQPPLPYGYSDDPDLYSPTIARQFLAWLETAGPRGEPISMTGVYNFDDLTEQFVNQDSTWQHPTFFDDTFACGVKVEGTMDGVSTFQGIGEDIQSYFAKIASQNK